MTYRCCTVAAAALLSAFLSAAPAGACVTVTDVVESIESEIVGVDIKLAEGPMAKRVAAGISSVTGAAVPEGGSFVLADPPDGALTYVVRIASGCATHHGRFPRQLVRAWIEGQTAENPGHD